MKNYNEMADDVFRRRDEFVQKQKRTRRSIAASLSCVCLAVLVGVGVWQSEIFLSDVQQAEDAIYPGIKDNYGPGEEPTVNENGIYQPSGTVTLENGEKLKLISSYEKASASACYALPKDGTHHYSIPLNAALEEYEDKVIYRVIVRVYEDGKMVQGKELQKIADMFYDWGYSSALEITDDNWERAVLTMLVKEDALKNFKADADHGYFFFLFEESDGAGNQWQNANGKYDGEKACFKGKVIEKYENNCLVEVTDNGNQHFMLSDRVIVKTDIEGCPNYTVGDYLKIEFDGIVAESYPLQILNVFSITLESESE
ncbi:MAG: hypothetical protein IIU80_03345 [Clostridia bacterium]|nr:hypothetical protein [Clostridia bacterium]